MSLCVFSPSDENSGKSEKSFSGEQNAFSACLKSSPDGESLEEKGVQKAQPSSSLIFLAPQGHPDIISRFLTDETVRPSSETP